MTTMRATALTTSTTTATTTRLIFTGTTTEHTVTTKNGTATTTTATTTAAGTTTTDTGTRFVISQVRGSLVLSSSYSVFLAGGARMAEIKAALVASIAEIAVV